MTVKPAPLIKEHRLDKLETCLECIDRHAFNRDKQRDCIMSVYPEKSEKSVFRGMVIPSARHLGLIVGYGDFIRLSANAKIMLESRALGDEVHQRVVRAVLHEVDEKKFGFLRVLCAEGPAGKDAFFRLVRPEVGAPSQRQADERTRRWLSMLMQARLVEQGRDDCLRIRQPEYERTLQDVDAMLKDVVAFREYLFIAFFQLTRGRAPLADIADLREKVAIQMLISDERLILTEAQFDRMLARTPFSTGDYMISLGRPMGAEEKLFEYHGKHFRTLSIRFPRKREV